MRLWTIHPCHLDSRGLVALWREGLLAQAVLKGETQGYRNHPQLARFKAQASPKACIGAYLVAVHAESLERGYRFDESKIAEVAYSGFIDVSTGQIQFEWQHLQAKLAIRSPEHYASQTTVKPRLHPLFRLRPGGIESWERSTT
ncbi:MAG: DNA lyase [Gammaproteobacteria bacterium]|nr:DNA lyase [Gammaproteobacteria bacterium]